MNVLRTPVRTALLATVAALALPASAALAQGAIEEIVVTARKRAETLQEVPLAVSAFTAEEMNKRGVEELEDIALYTPGLAFEDFASSFSAAPTLRGLTQVNVSSEVQNVSSFIDGVYVQRNYAVDIGTADIARIEVVKGPQSALYGQNAFAGAINYVLNRPGETFEALGRVTVGTDGRLDTQASAGGPIVPGKLGVRASFSHAEFDGTWRNAFPGATGRTSKAGGYNNDNYSVTAVLTPVDRIEINGTYMRVERTAGIRAGYSVNTGDVQNRGNCGPRNANGNPIFICGTLSVDPGPYQSAASLRPAGTVINLPTPGFVNETDFYRGEFRAEVLDDLSLVYQYGRVDARGQEISAPTVNPVTPSITTNLNALAVGQVQLGRFNSAQKEGSTNAFDSHELRFDYEPQGGPIKGTLGFYHSEFRDIYRFNLSSVPQGQVVTDTTTGFLDMTGFPFPLRNLNNTGRTTAVFGAASYTFADRLTVGAELRYSAEQKGLNDATARITLGDNFSNWIPRFTVDYKLTDEVLVYASAAKGVKTGGFNGVQAGQVRIPDDEQAFGPESNWTYEIGAKSTLLDGRLVLNAAAYYVDWSDMQIQALPSNTPANLVNNTPVIFRNLGNARSQGIELEGAFALTDQLSARLGVSLNDPKFKSGTTSFRFNGRCDNVVCPANTDVSGKTLPRTPKTQVSGGVEWADSLGNDWEYYVRADAAYQSKLQVEEMNIGQIQSRFLVNARAGFGKDFWELSVWGKNIFNKKYVANSFFIIQGVSYGTALGEKATAGVTLTVRY